MLCMSSFDLGNWAALCTCSPAMTDGIYQNTVFKTKINPTKVEAQFRQKHALITSVITWLLLTDYKKRHLQFVVLSHFFKRE